MMLIDINLLPQKEQERPYPLIIAGVLVLLALLSWALLFFMAQAEERAQDELIEESAQVAAEQEAIRQQIGATEGLNDEQQLKETVEWAESYQFDTVPLLDELVAVLPERGFFDTFSFTGPNLATLTLQFDTAREAAYYLTQLKTAESLASVTLDSVTNQELDLIEEETIEDEDALLLNPRYLATYSLVFVDDRIPAEGTVAEDGTIIEEEVEGDTEQPVGDDTEETPEVVPEEPETAPDETEEDAL